MKKFLTTFFKGKLTGLGLNGLFLTEVLDVIPEITTIWTTGSGQEIGLSGLLFAIASIWGWVRRFTPTYKQG